MVAISGELTIEDGDDGPVQQGFRRGRLRAQGIMGRLGVALIRRRGICRRRIWPKTERLGQTRRRRLGWLWVQWREGRLLEGEGEVRVLAAAPGGVLL